MFRFLLTSAGVVALGIGAFKLLKKKTENQEQTTEQSQEQQPSIN